MIFETIIGIILLSLTIVFLFLNILSIIKLVKQRKVLKKSKKILIYSWLTFSFDYIIVFLAAFIYGIWHVNILPTVYPLTAILVSSVVGISIFLLVWGLVVKHNEKKQIKKEQEDSNLKNLNTVIDETIICQYCQTKIDKTDKKCPNCGAHIK